jgi:hypothetical protein
MVLILLWNPASTMNIFALVIEKIDEVAGAEAPIGEAAIRSALADLLKDAASTWRMLADALPVMFYDWPFFQEHDACTRLIASIENSAPGEDVLSRWSAQIESRDRRRKQMRLPSASQVQRMRIVAEALPALLQQARSDIMGANRRKGSAKDPTSRGRQQSLAHRRAWQVLWYDATGMTAPKIAEKIHNPREVDRDGNPTKELRRNAIFRIKKSALDAVAGEIERRMIEAAKAAA